MGINHWIARRGAKNIVKAMLRHYRQGLAVYKRQRLDDMPALYRDVVGSRYKRISPSEKELAIIQEGIENLTDFYDAAFLVILAEGDVDQDFDPTLYQLYAETVVNEISKIEGIPDSDQNIDSRSRLTQLMEKFAHIRTRALD
jgi:hypothetical protein